MKPAEMRALEELPGQTKDALLPLIPLRPWVGAHKLDSVIQRIGKSYGDRPVVISLAEREPSKDRQVFEELDRLRSSRNGFANWCDFIGAHNNYIPVPQLSIEPSQEAQQIAALYALGRGLVVHVERVAFPNLSAIAAMVGQATGGGVDVCFVIDFGSATRDHLQVAAITAGYIQSIRNHAPYSYVSVSASSFPSSFNGKEHQEIYERTLFNELVETDLPRLIYGDRGSARAEPLSGGSGVIPPRIDYPLFNDWYFFRSEDPEFSGYVEEAAALMASEIWNGDLRVWGTQMIERTARGDNSAIDSPLKATAARINLHVQLQTFYGSINDAEDTEEDWEG
jgi:hypothetical protein